MPAPDPDEFDPRLLEEAVKGQLIGSKIFLLARTSSTNDEIWKQAESGAAPGLVVFAEEQTAGRGQRGNSWESPAGKALLFSILLRPRLDPAESSRLTDWAAKAVASSVEGLFSIPTRIKAPNDIYVDKAKIAGVLVEMRAQAGQPHLAIVGIGVNLNQTREDFSSAIRECATSLALATGKKVHRQKVATALLRELERTYPSVAGR
jgi:BirA family transcriptional regulator, biotin operon repressor / biotin---[acetyl-CoA-carboxylase] ligase